MKKFVAIVTGILLTAGLTACGDTEVKEVKRIVLQNRSKRRKKVIKYLQLGIHLK